jgi:Tfp pilus assembly protein PilX
VLNLARLAARLRDERGVAMVMAIGITLVLAMSTMAMIEFTSSGSRTSSLSRSSSIAQSLAEAGINDAQARLNDPANNALTPSLLTGTVACPNGVAACFESAYDGGTTRWYGTFNAAASVWTITSWGLTRNPTDGTLTVQRVIRATTAVVADPTQPYNGTAWNYVLATGTSNSTTCDVIVNENAWIDVDFYIQGNLCLDNNGGVIEPDHAKPVELIVHGKVEFENHGHVGLSTTDRISKAKIGGGCTTNINHAGHVCTTADDFYVGEYTQIPTQINAPVPDYAGWYATAKPGPRFPCTTATGPVPTWDNDTTLNLATAGSAPTFNLTPSTQSYSCKYEQNGATVGELTWSHTTKRLTIRGVMYFDGSMTASGATIVYDGSATIYLTGTITFANDTIFCAVNVGTACDFNTWDPSSEMLIFVANGGSNVNSVVINNGTHFQGGFQAKNTVDVGNVSTIEGPMIAQHLSIKQNVTFKPLPTVTDLPLGAPGNPNTHATPTAPRYG